MWKFALKNVTKQNVKNNKKNWNYSLEKSLRPNMYSITKPIVTKTFQNEISEKFKYHLHYYWIKLSSLLFHINIHKKNYSNSNASFHTHFHIHKASNWTWKKYEINEMSKQMRK